MNITLETILYGIIAFVLIGLVISVIVLKSKSSYPKRPLLNTDKIIDAVGKENILEIFFKREKVNIVVKDYAQVKIDQLKEAGCIGINIVGNTIKYYVESDNETHYKALLADLERK
ncbi:MAG: hypothetical protein ACLFRI_02645 [Candidatus Izemoplasmataceae bacterium]